MKGKLIEGLLKKFGELGIKIQKKREKRKRKKEDHQYQTRDPSANLERLK